MVIVKKRCNSSPACLFSKYNKRGEIIFRLLTKKTCYKLIHLQIKAKNKNKINPYNRH